MQKSASSGPISSGTSRLRERRSRPRRPRVTNARLIVAILVVFTIGAILSGEAAAFLSKLYGGAAIVLMVVLIIEYIVLKGRDRSRIYKIEIESMREKRHKDLEFLQSVERELAGLDESLQVLADIMPEDKTLVAHEIAHTRQRLEVLLKRLAKNL